MLVLGVPTTECAADAASNSCLSAGMAPELTAGMPQARQIVAYSANVPPAWRGKRVNKHCAGHTDYTDQLLTPAFLHAYTWLPAGTED
jgi:hypothetical protein